jgi:hypothetical protein
MNFDITPSWYSLIKTAIVRGDIVTGLTIPYLIGAQRIGKPNFQSDRNTICELIEEMSNSITELNPVLQMCGLIHQYVVALKTPQSCEENFKSEIHFCNEYGIESLYVIHEAKSLGNTINEISDKLFEEYKINLSERKYSWCYTKKIWQEFNEREKETISMAVK